MAKSFLQVAVQSFTPCSRYSSYRKYPLCLLNKSASQLTFLKMTTNQSHIYGKAPACFRPPALQGPMLFTFTKEKRNMYKTYNKNKKIYKIWRPWYLIIHSGSKKVEDSTQSTLTSHHLDYKAIVMKLQKLEIYSFNFVLLLTK